MRHRHAAAQNRRNRLRGRHGMGRIPYRGQCGLRREHTASTHAAGPPAQARPQENLQDGIGHHISHDRRKHEAHPRHAVPHVCTCRDTPARNSATFPEPPHKVHGANSACIAGRDLRSPARGQATQGRRLWPRHIPVANVPHRDPPCARSIFHACSSPTATK